MLSTLYLTFTMIPDRYTLIMALVNNRNQSLGNINILIYKE